MVSMIAVIIIINQIVCRLTTQKTQLTFLKRMMIKKIKNIRSLKLEEVKQDV